MTITERVAAGAVLLDKETPDWAERISLEELRLESCEHCILGQVYDHYNKGKRKLGLEFEDAQKYGFSPYTHRLSDNELAVLLTTNKYPDWCLNQSRELVKAWKVEIEERVYANNQ